MVLIVAVSIVELAIILYKEIADTPKGSLFLDIGELLRIFGFVFMVIKSNKICDACTNQVQLRSSRRRVSRSDQPGFDPVLAAVFCLFFPSDL